MNDNYIHWKSWKVDDFAQCSTHLSNYYKKELAKSGVNVCSHIRVLEIGFGNGSFLGFAERQGWTITGVEVSKDLLDRATYNGFDVLNYKEISSLGENTFDLIVAFDVFEHLDRSELEWLFPKLKSLLKDDSVLIARFPNGDSPFGLRSFNGDFTHKTFLSSGKIYYLSDFSGLFLHSLRGEVEPLFGTGLRYFLFRVVSIPVKALINIFYRLIYSPRKKVEFAKANLVAVFINKRI